MVDRHPVHQVLWTGGWDSTYRVADLLLVHRRSVQPWYVVDPERRTAAREQTAMAELAEAMAQLDPAVRDLLLPVRTIALADLPDDDAVTAAVQRVGAQAPMGSQYSWLPRLVALAGWQVLEFSHEDDGRYKLVPFAAFRRYEAAPPDDWFTVCRSACDADRYRLFGGFRYPILDVTKVQMAERARRHGFAEILDRTWTCRWPTVLGRPCGQCVPCRQVRAAGLRGRVPPDTRLRRLLHRWRWGWVRRRQAAQIRVRAARGRFGG